MSIANRTYKDMAYSLFANPMSGDVGKKTGANAVKGAIVSILKTNYNERMFQPEFGSDIRALLFEHMNPITEQRIKTEVAAAVARHEPRAQVISIKVEGEEEHNRYLVTILFNVTSEAEPQKLEVLFDRV